ncbi:DUF4407 domain-containing protein [Lewinella cohaerens]|uniref:DUF4407 domain-containing protein n=1 Tax=Lewinella cohaerens TaxID=70995 RepID=UPI000367B1B5|nr:DUF4407 domain-containing protein [Lewinella cohaerens]
MNDLKQFFLFCAGIDQQILKQCPSDENKYLGIGATVFFTGVLAFFSSAYALFTVFDSWLAAVLFGTVWGLMIFNLDRYIVSSMKSKRGFFGNLGMALPRLALAILLALVISKPLELKIFEKEINSEVLIMEQEKYKEQEDRIQERYAPQIAVYEADVLRLQAEIDAKTSARDAKALAALQEADGSGGSEIRNMGPIYRAKKADADQAQQELDQTLALNQPLIVEKTTAITTLQTQVATDISTLERGAFGGLAARTEALARLAQQSEAIHWASLFVMLLFVAVETAPILVKLISPRSPYDYLLAEHEQQFELAAKESMDVRKSEVLNRVREKTEVGLHQTKSDIKLRKAEIDAEIQQQLDRLRNGGWKYESNS